MTDLNLLYVFEALWRDRSVTIAAENLGLSQAAVSTSLKRIRREYGDKMFSLVGRRMEPTPFATMIAQDLLDALSLVRKTAVEQAQFEPLASKQTFTIRTRDIGEAVCFPKIIDELKKQAPQVKVRSIFLPIDETFAGLANGRIDIALGFLPSLESDIHRLSLFTQNYVCVFRKGHPISNRKLTLELFREQDHILVEYSGSGHRPVEQALITAGVKDRIVVRQPQYLSAPYLIVESDLLWTVPAVLAETLAKSFPLEIRQLPFELPEFEIAVYWHDRFHRDPANKWFRDLIAKLLRSNPK